MLSNDLHYVSPRDDAERAFLEALIRDEYDRCHPDDRFDDLKRRAQFSKEDLGLYRDWLAVAAMQATDSKRLTAAA